MNLLNNSHFSVFCA